MMNVGRFYHTATRLVDGTVLIAGGNGGNSGNLASAELYNPLTQTFTLTAGGMSAGRLFDTATLLNSGKVLMVGGIDPGGNVLASVEQYDPLTGTFTPAGALNSPRQAHAATRMYNGMILIAGGTNHQSVLYSAAELF